MPLNQAYKRDVTDIQSISIVPNLLEVICRSTGMGFAAIARVTQDKWVTCGVLDKISFGLAPGDELEVKSTICHEVRQEKEMVVIDHVDQNTAYCSHHTPLRYGFQSYISVPIVRKNGEFFGTLCAIDPKPNKLNNRKVVGMFMLFADLISFHLETIGTVREKNRIIEKKDFALRNYGFVSSHNLQEPLRKIQTFANLLQEKEVANLTRKGKEYFKGIGREATRMRHVLDDLLSFTETDGNEHRFESADLKPIVERAAYRLRQELDESGASLAIGPMCQMVIVPELMEQLFYNVLANAIAFRSPDRELSIDIGSTVHLGEGPGHGEPELAGPYIEVTVSDNGKGFDQLYADKIFGMFQRLENHKDDRSTGIGLAIARKIVLGHHGKIVAIGELGKGAAIRFCLPIRQ